MECSKTVSLMGKCWNPGCFDQVPKAWWKTVTMPNGKPDATAIIVLADIVSWYRPRYMLDEETGRTREARAFKADMLQRSYEQLADEYGFTKRQVKRAIDHLVSMGVLIREFRTVQASEIDGRGKALSNVMFLDLDVSKLLQLTHPGGVPKASQPNGRQEAPSEHPPRPEKPRKGKGGTNRPRNREKAVKNDSAASDAQGREAYASVVSQVPQFEALDRACVKPPKDYGRAARLLMEWLQAGKNPLSLKVYYGQDMERLAQTNGGSDVPRYMKALDDWLDVQCAEFVPGHGMEA